jgi:pyrimidine-specific ribonucleoside hydrolase
MSESKIPVIIDCDPGIDDTMALAAAFAQPNLEVLAVCSVAGNVGIEKTTANARAVVGVLGVNCPVYKGAESALMPGGAVEAPEAHGVSGLGNFTLPPEKFAPLEAQHAVNAQYRLIMQNPAPVTLIAVGPLTNLALLLRMYPETKPRLKGISLMGGALYGGNHTPAAEFNVLADPEAAEIVYQSGVPITMAGLDVTRQACFSLADYRRLGAVQNPAAQMLYRALGFTFGPEGGPQKPYACMHDAVSVLAVSMPDMMRGRRLPVQVETAGRYSRGCTLADFRDPAVYGDVKPANCNVLTEIDRERFAAELLRCAQSYG